LEQISYQKKIQLEQILNKKNSNHKKFWTGTHLKLEKISKHEQIFKIYKKIKI
jgi:hypothetical protein